MAQANILTFSLMLLWFVHEVMNTNCGSSMIETDDFECMPCPLGRVKLNSTFCQHCPKGKYGDANKKQTVCRNCKRGHVTNVTGETACTTCLRGRYERNSTSCHYCIPGRYVAGDASHTTKHNLKGCTKCQQGYFSESAGASECLACPAGRYTRDSTFCPFCQAGRFSNKNATRAFAENAHGCRRCGKGHVANTTGATECIPCQAGRVEVDHKICTYCAAGRYGVKNASYIDHNTPNGGCKQCATGFFSEMLGSTACTPCPAGSFGDSGFCRKCPPGRYTSKQRQTSCFECPPDSFASEEGRDQCTRCNETFFGVRFQSTSPRDCVCPAGFRFETWDVHERSDILGHCRLCLASEKLECRGGYQQTDMSGIDLAVKVEEGYMTLSTSRFSVYSCVDGADRCPGKRFHPDPNNGTGQMCRIGFNNSVVRCALCENGRYLGLDRTCEHCKASDGADLCGKIAVSAVVQLLLVVYMYNRWNRPNPAGLIMLGSFVTFVQALQALGRLPLKWPPNLRWILNILENITTLPGLFFMLQFRGECLMGHGHIWKLARDAFSPLLIFVDFLVMGLFCYMGRACGKRHMLKVNYVINVIGVFFTKLFISISALTMELFFVDTMPNKKTMVKAFAELEFLSSAWYEALPINLASLIVFCGTALVVIAHAVWRAPWMAASHPKMFVERYRFAFGALRPDCWWWVLVQLMFGSSMNLAQAVSNNVKNQLYLTVFGLIVFTTAQFVVRPFKFDENNTVELTFKCALSMVMVFATSYVDPELEGSHTMNDFYGDLSITLLLLAGIFTSYAMLDWALVQCRPTGFSVGRAAQLVWRFRDAAMAQALMPEAEILEKVMKLADVDLTRLELATKTLVTSMMGMQVDGKWLHQRVMPGVPYALWNPRATAALTLTAAESGKIHERSLETARVRHRIMNLARDVRARLQEGGFSEGIAAYRHRARKSLHGARVKVAKIFDANSHTVLRMGSALSLHDDDMLSVEQFQNRVEGLLGLGKFTMDDAQMIFNIMDFKHKGVISIHEFYVAMTGLAPIDLVEEISGRSFPGSCHNMENLAVDETVASDRTAVDVELRPSSPIAVLHEQTAADEVTQNASGKRSSIIAL